MSALPQSFYPATRPDSPLLTVAEVADYLRVSEMTVYRLITRGELAAAKIGRRYRVRTDDLQAFVAGAACDPTHA